MGFLDNISINWNADYFQMRKANDVLAMQLYKVLDTSFTAAKHVIEICVYEDKKKYAAKVIDDSRTEFAEFRCSCNYKSRNRRDMCAHAIVAAKLMIEMTDESGSAAAQQLFSSYGRVAEQEDLANQYAESAQSNSSTVRLEPVLHMP